MSDSNLPQSPSRGPTHDVSIDRELRASEQGQSHLGAGHATAEPQGVGSQMEEAKVSPALDDSGRPLPAKSVVLRDSDTEPPAGEWRKLDASESCQLELLYCLQECMASSFMCLWLPCWSWPRRAAAFLKVCGLSRLS